ARNIGRLRLVLVAEAASPQCAFLGWVLLAKLLNHRRFRDWMAVPSKRVDRSILSFFHCLRRESNLEVLAVNSHGGSSPPPRTPKNRPTATRDRESSGPSIDRTPELAGPPAGPQPPQ